MGLIGLKRLGLFFGWAFVNSTKTKWVIKKINGKDFISEEREIDTVLRNIKELINDFFLLQVLESV